MKNILNPIKWTLWYAFLSVVATALVVGGVAMLDRLQINYPMVTITTVLLVIFLAVGYVLALINGKIIPK